jgi:peptidoglycan/xylan/chitin deacetylase (PgdA/CDA1 family)
MRTGKMIRLRATPEGVRWLLLFVLLATSANAFAEDGMPLPPPKPAKAAKPPKLTSVKPEPTEFTNDPVLGVATRVNGEEVHGVVTFTFDDGPNPETTPTVVDALDKYNIPATFFVVTQRLLGKHGQKSRDILSNLLERGYLVGSHSVTHRWLGKADAKLLDKELDPSLKTLSTEAKRPIGLFRAPYGALNGTARVRLRKLGVTEVFWSIDTLDWQAKDADKLRKKVLAMILKQNGGVVLMHDIRPVTAKVIDGVLDDLEAENCKRLAAKAEPIWPVSIHYFLRDGKTARAIPDDVTKRTDAYKKALPERCLKRPPPPAPPATSPPNPAVVAPIPAK